MSDYFPQTKFSGRRVKVELHLSNYARKVSLKNATDADTSTFAKQVDLADLKSDADKLDIDKLKNVPSNLGNLKSKVDKIPDITNSANNTTLNAKINKVKNEIPSITNLGTTTALNVKINEVKNKIPNVINLATTTALTAVENKIPNVSNLVQKLNILQKLMKLKIKVLLIMIVINILINNLIS